ncbi:tetratricopeptide repeat protein [Colwellia sp. MEBiC06753]
MSVINQMLKDLEKRNSEPSTQADMSQSALMASQKPKSPMMPIVLTFIVTVAAVAVFWLYSQNQVLQNQVLEKQLLEKQVQQNQAQQNQNQSQTNQNQVNHSQVNHSQAQSLPAIETSITKNNKTDEPKSELLKDNNWQQKSELINAEQVAVEPNGEQSITTINLAPKSEPKPSPVKPLPDEAQVDPAINRNANVQAAKPQSSLSIARKQLSPSELAKQKMAQAYQAIEQGEGNRAEQLMQDVLLLKPEHLEARKQLTAIWFAQGNTQAAFNLVNQGITLMPQEPSFRLMAAKILLQQQLNKAAFEVLSVLKNTPQVEYQSLLAQSASAVEQQKFAISAYQHLIKLQPNNAKWHLGLAISHDKNSGFNEAIASYKEALVIGGLSAASQAFAEQRISALGD